MKQHNLKFSTSRKYCLVNITNEVQSLVKKSRIENGLCVVFVPHATAGIVVNEDEEGVKEDILKRILALAPESLDYQHDHIDNNARAHIIASILGPSITFIIENSGLKLGTWQEIFFVELDGPRGSRSVIVKIIED